MLALTGEVAIWVALLAAVWSACIALAGAVARNDRVVVAGAWSLHAAAACTAVGWLALVASLAARDLSLRYVASHITLNLPLMYRLAAMQAGHAGAMLTWCAALAAVTVAVGIASRRALPPARAVVTVALAVLLAGFLGATLSSGSPFEKLAWIPQEGRGLSPSLQHVAMLLQPMVMSLGLAAAAGPFALALAGLVARSRAEVWLATVRRWTLVAWLLMLFGIVMGMWWAYTDPTRAHSWPMDSVANASLLPWLAATALLHTSVVGLRRSLLLRWNVTLTVATFLLALIAAAIGRAGVVEGVYAITAVREGPWLLGIVSATIAASGWALSRAVLPPPGLAPRAVSRESALLSSNVVLGGIIAAALVAVVPPPATMGAGASAPAAAVQLLPLAAVPLGVLLLLLMGIGQRLDWGGNTIRDAAGRLAIPATAGALLAGVLVIASAPWRAAVFCGLALFVVTAVVSDLLASARDVQRRSAASLALSLGRALAADRWRYGGYLTHVGVVLLIVGLTGTAHVQRHEVELGAGESFSTVDPWGRAWTFTSQGVSSHEQLNRSVRLVALRPARDGVALPLVRSEQRRYFDSFGREPNQGTTTFGIIPGVRQDVTVQATALARDSRATFEIAFHPLVTAVWIGAVFAAAGALLAFWPAGAPAHGTNEAAA